MAKLFAKPVQNKTHREELHGFIFFVTTNSEGFFFSNSSKWLDEDDNVLSSLFCCVIGDFSEEKKLIFLGLTFLSK